MSKLDKERLDWIERNRSLLVQLSEAAEKMEYGQIIINYHAGEVVSIDVCPRIRTVAKEEGKADHEDI